MIGTLINERYRVIAELGRGGMGVVYNAHDELLDRDVAVKVLSASELGSQGRARLLHEARAAARLNHPNIINVYDAGEMDGSSYIVMELLHGDSLYERRPTSLAEILTVARQILAALGHAHSHGIVHRDLKPENVFLTPEGVVKLTDFGLAHSVASRVSVDGAIIGTVFYLPPEQALGQTVDGRSDLYSLGAMLYELLTGRLPFSASDPLVVVSQHLYAPVVPPRTYAPDLPPALDSLILRMLAKKPEDRPATAAEVLQAINELGIDVSGQARPPLELILPETISPVHRLVLDRMVGRERELEEARGLWMSAQGGVSQVLTVSGETGIGKTPFIRDVTAMVRMSSGLALMAECYSEGTTPYAPVVQWLRAGLPLLSPGALSGAALAALVHFVSELAVNYPDMPVLAPVEPRAEQQRLFESFAAFCAALSAQAPLLLVVEDIHWADSGTLYLIRHLARRARAGRLPLMIVLTYREEDLNQCPSFQEILFDLNHERLLYRIKLARFNHDQTRQILEVMFQQEVPEDFVDGIYRETEGNLFYMEEVVKSLVEEGKICIDCGQWELPAMTDLQIPQSVRLAIETRLEKLSPSAREALRLAAIIGREFDFVTLRHASDLDEETLIEALELAAQTRLIEEIPGRGQAHEERFAFAHSLIPATLREGLSGMRRHRLHRRVVSAIEKLRPEDYETLAYHAEQAGDEDCARTYFELAGKRALEVFANQEAYRYLQIALDIPGVGSETDRARLLCHVAEALFRLVRYGEAAQAWQEAAGLFRTAGDHGAFANATARAARAIWHTQDNLKPLEICLKGLDTVKALVGSGEFPPETPGMAALLHEAGRSFRFQNRSVEARPYVEKALDMAEQLELVEIQADTLATMGILQGSSYEEKRAILIRAVELAESAGALGTAIRAHDNLADVLTSIGDYPGARAQCLRNRELAHLVGIPLWEYRELAYAASVSLDMADLAAAESELEEVRQIRKGLAGPTEHDQFVEVLEAHVRFRRGQQEEALNRLERIRDEITDKDADAHRIADISWDLAILNFARGDLVKASAYLRETVANGDRAQHWDRSTSRGVLAVLLARQGLLEEAQIMLLEARALAGPYPTAAAMRAMEWAEAGLAEAEARFEDAWNDYDEAARGCGEMGARWYQALILQDWANALVRSGRSEQDTKVRGLRAQVRAILR
ncbi:MAG TPA: protein kinase [Anaerolineaceae bacterium]|nr:protein kinase [Anaerolineaceae bacterium]